MIKLELKYIANGIFNISRRHQGGFMPERVCEVCRNDGIGLYTYYDGVSVTTRLLRTHDEYSQLLVTTSIPDRDGSPVDTEVVLEYWTEAPVLLTFRCEESYSETMSTEGGISRECVVGDHSSFAWRQGTYAK